MIIKILPICLIYPSLLFPPEYVFKFFNIYFILFIFLAVSGLSCSMQDLSMHHAGFSLVVALGLSSCSGQA